MIANNAISGNYQKGCQYSKSSTFIGSDTLKGKIAESNLANCWTVELLNCFPFLMDSISLKLFQEFNFKNLEFREFNFWLQNVEEKGEKSAIQGDR